MFSLLGSLSTQQLVLITIIATMIGLILVTVISLIRKRDEIDFCSLIVTEQGNISKVGISFIIIQFLIIYQIVSNEQISSYLVELLGVIFAAEIGTKYVESKKISHDEIVKIKKELSKFEPKEKSHHANKIDDIDFDKI